MTLIQATELAAYEAKHAREQAVQQMQEAINHFQRTHYEMYWHSPEPVDTFHSAV